jgi:predicted amidophosphoribosyltransferase
MKRLAMHLADNPETGLRAGERQLSPEPSDGSTMGIFSFLERVNIPQDCHLCGMASPRVICAGCDDDLVRVSTSCCQICALPLPAAGLCGRCLAEPPAFDATAAALRYEFPATRLVQAFKYRGAVGLAGTLASLLENAIQIQAASAGRPVASAEARAFNSALAAKVAAAVQVVAMRLHIMVAVVVVWVQAQT